MPLPKPRYGESMGKFISRCVGDSIAKKEFPDHKQRIAVCYSAWRRRKK